MLKQPMIEKLLAMRLNGMAESLKTQEQDPAARELSFLERLGLLVDQQWNWRENQALGRRLKNAKLRTNACVEDIDYRGARGLDKSVIRALVQESAWVGTHENVFVLGPTGVGKSFVVATGTRLSTPEPNRYSAIWGWRVPMAASAVCWRGLAASTF
jgi:DNA replication protein DnaC